MTRLDAPQRSALVVPLTLCLLSSLAAAHQDVRHLGRAITNFAFDLYRELDVTSSNTVFSPLGLSGLMSMFVDGTEGETQQQLIKALKLEEFEEPKEISPAYQQLYGALENISAEEMTFTMASRISPKKGLKLETQYIRSMLQHYGATVEELDFAQDPTGVLKNINEWISDNTNGMVKEALKAELDAGTILALMNAMYFRGTWLQPFPINATHVAKFHGIDNKPVDVAMMTLNKVDLYYMHDPAIKFTMFELPYNHNGTCMLVILPDPGANIYNVMEQLREKGIANVIDDMSGYELFEVQMPRFKVETSYKLEGPLENMGISRLFGPQAQMEPMFGYEGPRLTDVSHATSLEVTETGTEAGSASIGSVVVTVEKLRVIVDRPFAFLVYDKHRECTLFLGAVMTLPPTTDPSLVGEQVADREGVSGASGSIGRSSMVWGMVAAGMLLIRLSM